MKKTAIRLREIGLPTSGTNASVSTFRPSSSGRLQPLTMASSAASGAGILARRLGQHLGRGDREGEAELFLAQADRLLFALPGRFPAAVGGRPAQQAHGLRRCSLLGGHHVEDDADLAGAVGLGRVAGADHLGGQRGADQAR